MGPERKVRFGADARGRGDRSSWRPKERDRSRTNEPEAERIGGGDGRAAQTARIREDSMRRREPGRPVLNVAADMFLGAFFFVVRAAAAGGEVLIELLVAVLTM